MKIKTDIIIRVYMVYAILLVFALAIIFQVAKLQYIQGDKWRAMADSLSLGYQTVEAARGNIYSQDGRLLATSIPQYDIRMDTRTDGLSTKEFLSEVDSLAWHLSRLFKDRSAGSYANRLKTARRNGERYYLIERDVSFNQLKKLKEFPIFRNGKFSGGLIAVRHNERILPFRELAERTIGYDRETVQPVGLEGVYSEYLDGQSGKRLMRRLAGGVWIPVNEDEEIAPIDGCDVISTININIQDVAHNALKQQLQQVDAKWGTAILMEVQTGEIKAVVNLTRTGDDLYQETYNYAIAFSSEPGSTFKLASFIAGIEDGKFDLDTKVATNGGVATFHGLSIRDSHHMPPYITMKRAFEESSNVVIAKAIYNGYHSDPAEYTDHLKAMGLGKKLGLQIPGEGRTRIKDPEDKDWYGTTLPWMAHGYEVLLTPLQLLAFYNGVANDGTLLKPLFVTEIQKNGQVIKKIEPQILVENMASEETIRKAQALLKAVVTDGTASKLFNTVYSIAGKTGTAVIADGANGYRNGRKKYRGSFCGYFPADNPQYSILVVVSDPDPSKGFYGSAVAAPVFKEIADKVYSTRPDLQPALKEQYPVLQVTLPKSGSGNSNDIFQIYRNLGIAVSKPEEGQWAEALEKDSSIVLQPVKLVAGIMPDITGMDLEDALYLTENAGLKTQVQGHGKVISQIPEAGSKIIDGQKITIKLN